MVTFTFAVDEDVGGLEVAMDELCGVEVLEAPQDLVEDVAHMHALQDGLAHQGVQVCLHVIEKKIQVLVVLCPYYSVQFDYVIVIQLVQDRNFAVGALCIHIIVKGVKYLLKSAFLAIFFVDYLPYVSIGSTAEQFLYLEESQQFGLYFFAHFFGNRKFIFLKPN